MENKTTNKKLTLRFRAVNDDFFQAIRNGKKKVETRAATIKYRNVKPGDLVEFVCGKKRFSRTVKSAQIFKSVNAMLRVHKFTDIMPNAKSIQDLEQSYNSFPGYREKLKKFGIIALKFKK